jgi:hypothetical protein
VTVAIDLNQELQPRTIEIYNIFMNRFLSQEGISQHFAAFQLVSQQHFRQRAAVPQFLRIGFQFWAVVKDDLYL